MPELPEVEILCRRLDECCGGRRVARAELASISALKTFEPPLRSLAGRVVDSCSRRGKYVCFQLSPGGATSLPPAERAPLAAGGAGSAEPSAAAGRDLPAAAPIWLVIHLARGGWIKWRRQLTPAPARPGEGAPRPPRGPRRR